MFFSIVENAVIHGLENSGSGGHVCIETKALSKMLNEQSQHNEDRIGLKNVYQRLQLTFGEKSEISIVSKLNIGTKIFIFIPIEEGRKDV